MEQKKTSLSAGAVVCGILLSDKEVAKRATKVFPIVTDNAKLPYIVYRRAALEHNPTKSRMPGADTITMEVDCYTEKYAEGVELAEAVRAALDYASGACDGMTMRSCMLVGSEEAYDGDAFVQQLVFQVKI